MSDLISRIEAVEKVRELFSLGDCYCDEHSIVGMLNGLLDAERTSTVEKTKVFYRNVYRCAACGNLMLSQYSDNCFVKYCPGCGAKLDWSEL